MRAFIIRSNTTVQPFGDDVGEAMVLFSTLRQATDLSLQSQRCQPEMVTDQLPSVSQDESVLVLSDRLFVSQKALKDFLAASKEQANARLSLRRTPAVDYLTPVTDAQPVRMEPAEHEQSLARLAKLEREAIERVDYDIYKVQGKDLPQQVGGEQLLDQLRQKCSPVIVKKRELALPVRLPTLGDGAAQIMVFPITSTVVCEVRHWVHILWLNQIAFGMSWMDILREHKLWAMWRLVTAFPYSKDRLFNRLVRVGKRCRIHPTAHIELSVLGDDVVVGPRASIRNSFIGSGSEIGDHAVVLSSTVGQGSFITAKTFLVWSAAYPGATIGNYKLQVSLIGRDAHVNPWAGFIDAKFKGSIMVDLDGELRSTQRSFLGSCIGHRAVFGAKALLQPGRMLPNDAVVVMRPDEVISEVPKDLEPGLPLVRHQGTLVPLKSLMPK